MTVTGLDVSYFQRGLDLRTLPVQGYSFAVARVSFGTSMADPLFGAFRQQAQEAKLLFAGYHFLTTGDVKKQAALVAANIGDRSIPLMIDCEPYQKSRPTLQTCLAFTHACQALGLAVTQLYLPRSWWQQIGRPALPSSFCLWNAAYPSSRQNYGSTLYPGDGHTQWSGYGGRDVDIWQYASSARADGYPRPFDVDAYRGSVAQLKASGWFKDYGPHVVLPTKPAGTGGATHTPPPQGATTKGADVPLTPADADLIWNHPITVGTDPKMLARYGYSHADGKYRASSLLVDASWRARDLDQRVAAIEAALAAPAHVASLAAADGAPQADASPAGETPEGQVAQ